MQTDSIEILRDWISANLRASRFAVVQTSRNLETDLRYLLGHTIEQARQFEALEGLPGGTLDVPAMGEIRELIEDADLVGLLGNTGNR